MTAGKSARILVALFAALALPGMAACKQQGPDAQRTGAPTEKVTGAAPVKFARETKSLTFTYDYPAQAAALPDLAALLNAERARSLSELEAQTAEARKEARDNDYPFHPHMLGVDWKVTGENTAMLAMVAEISSFSGGAHGNTGYVALVWDKAANQRVTLDAVFTSTAAALEPMRQSYCEALDVERLDRRGEPIGEDDDMFNACPPFSDLVMVPYASSDDGFDRIMMIAAPYVAGPYAEGAYEISLPLPAKTLDQVKPAYRSAFIANDR